MGKKREPRSRASEPPLLLQSLYPLSLSSAPPPQPSHADPPRRPLLPDGTVCSEASYASQNGATQPLRRARAGVENAIRFFSLSSFVLFLFDRVRARGERERKKHLSPPPQPPLPLEFCLAHPQDYRAPKGRSRGGCCLCGKRCLSSKKATAFIRFFLSIEKKGGIVAFFLLSSAAIGRNLTLLISRFSLSLASTPTQSTPGPRLGRQARARRRCPQGQAGPRRRRARDRRRRHGDARLRRRLGPHPVLAVQAVRFAPEEGGQGPPEETQAGMREEWGDNCVVGGGG